MQCHFEPLTGEVVIAGKAPPPQPAAKALIRNQKKQKGAWSANAVCVQHSFQLAFSMLSASGDDKETAGSACTREST